MEGMKEQKVNRITSTSNAQVKELIRLQKKRRARDEARVFIVEGPRMVSEIPPEKIVQLYVSEHYVEKWNASALHERFGKWEDFSRDRAVLLSDPVFQYVSDTKSPQGVLAVVRQSTYEMKDLLQGEGGEQAHILVLDHLQDPGNLGTIFRTAEAAGVTGLLVGGDSVDIYNPKVVRSTMGAIFRIPFVYTESLTAAVKELKGSGVRVYAAHLDAGKEYDQADYRGSTAFLIGNEGNGLRDEVAACADHRIKIPMRGEAESLNAAVAAAILMFETGRQRRHRHDQHDQP